MGDYSQQQMLNAIRRQNEILAGIAASLKIIANTVQEFDPIWLSAVLDKDN